MKPSEVSAATSKLLAELCPKYLDTNAIALVEGGVPETTTLLEQTWDHIFYTGNGTVGRIVMAAIDIDYRNRLKPSQLILALRSLRRRLAA